MSTQSAPGPGERRLGAIKNPENRLTSTRPHRQFARKIWLKRLFLNVLSHPRAFHVTGTGIEATLKIELIIQMRTRPQRIFQQNPSIINLLYNSKLKTKRPGFGLNRAVFIEGHQGYCILFWKLRQPSLARNKEF